MVPESELDLLFLSLEDAISLAIAGYLVDGYDCLLDGLRLAEESRAAGQPWDPALVRRYREALDSYAIRYGVRME